MQLKQLVTQNCLFQYDVAVNFIQYSYIIKLDLLHTYL